MTRNMHKIRSLSLTAALLTIFSQLCLALSAPELIHVGNAGFPLSPLGYTVNDN